MSKKVCVEPPETYKKVLESHFKASGTRTNMQNISIKKNYKNKKNTETKTNKTNEWPQKIVFVVYFVVAFIVFMICANNNKDINLLSCIVLALIMAIPVTLAIFITHVLIEYFKEN